jgi:ferredoxin
MTCCTGSRTATRRPREGSAVKACVDVSLCIGCELWVQLCPGVFRMDGEYAAVISEVVPPEHEKAARQAADECPVEAISISQGS